MYKAKGNKMKSINELTAQDWLNEWDNGNEVVSVSMGGLGAGYENGIQTIAFEIMRYLLETNPDPERMKNDPVAWDDYIASVDAHVLALDKIREIGPTGAMWGAAFNLAYVLYVKTPAVALAEPEILDRLIVVDNKGTVNTLNGDPLYSSLD